MFVDIHDEHMKQFYNPTEQALGAGTAIIHHRTLCTEAYAKTTNNDKCITRTIRLDNK